MTIIFRRMPIFEPALLSVLAALLLSSVAARVQAEPPNTLGLPPVVAPADNPTTQPKVELGRKLFNDASLSADGTISCASCHQASKAFSDGLSRARGIKGQAGTRNTPSLLNVAFSPELFWDGRRPNLEAQVEDPLLNPIEHGLARSDQVVALVRNNPDYVTHFEAAFGIGGQRITMEHVKKAIAAYERTLVVGNTAFDRYLYGSDSSALSLSAKRGLALFRGRAGCDTCHLIGETSALLTDNKFHSLGVGFKSVEARLSTLASDYVRAEGKPDSRTLAASDIAELGRFAVTRAPTDIGHFKTPSLRNVALTAPYMHDGSVATIEEAIELEIYYRGIQQNRPLILTPDEKTDLVEFLKSLTSTDLP